MEIRIARTNTLLTERQACYLGKKHLIHGYSLEMSASKFLTVDFFCTVDIAMCANTHMLIHVDVAESTSEDSTCVKMFQWLSRLQTCILHEEVHHFLPMTRGSLAKPAEDEVNSVEPELAKAEAARAAAAAAVKAEQPLGWSAWGNFGWIVE